jgi:hypothetical protein
LLAGISGLIESLAFFNAKKKSSFFKSLKLLRASNWLCLGMLEKNSSILSLLSSGSMATLCWL